MHRIVCACQYLSDDKLNNFHYPKLVTYYWSKYLFITHTKKKRQEKTKENTFEVQENNDSLLLTTAPSSYCQPSSEELQHFC